jgi:hypothetical protein
LPSERLPQQELSLAQVLDQVALRLQEGGLHPGPGVTSCWSWSEKAMSVPH